MLSVLKGLIGAPEKLGIGNKMKQVTRDSANNLAVGIGKQCFEHTCKAPATVITACAFWKELFIPFPRC